MRISDTQFSQMMLQSLQTNNAGLGKVLQQMATGDRLTKLSDDPMASIQLLNLDREGSAINQYQRNIANVKTTLSSQEVYLDSVNESLKSMRELVLWGSNGTLTDEDRDGMITELESLRDSIESSFNAQDEEGHYLFSGTKTDTPALSNSGAGYVVDGNSDKRVVTVAKGVTMESNMTAKDILELGGGNNVLNQIDALIVEFKNPSPNFQAEVDASLNAIDDTLGNVLGAMTEIGGRHNNLDLMDGAHGENKLFVDKVTSDISALDYGEASVRLSNYMAALQATQASYVKINDLSLFDRI
ncbi:MULTISPECIES: flagellar hook-associated protein FlgL [Vibrio]|jgi:flagellar hook-associated protein 3 FlgL|uniref:Flagellar hook-associated protein 3 n=2 Tax=Vibrio TaxID=662 RepID=A0A2S9ZTI9_9VIBR|nr:MULTISPECIES: flagellar hook-associated protein FlgL [Vibrio]AYV21489.1 flagellar hook-associated protein 3 [Vibrio mediterranei]EDL53286.1 flagellar hook-associated protein L [Vibrio mediterranei AK1]MCF4175507.1 flagellar hook-associated protein FlgL [Vibrio sp. McD22-P3]MCG9656609.1 flagellar hook-associated protein FlgL [Vibrio mediterranei]MCG9665354.1 flagellar hook-associated protein FlgL [Vibrio mediterranei]